MLHHLAANDVGVILTPLVGIIKKHRNSKRAAKQGAKDLLGTSCAGRLVLCFPRQNQGGNYEAARFRYDSDCGRALCWTSGVEGGGHAALGLRRAARREHDPFARAKGRLHVRHQPLRSRHQMDVHARHQRQWRDEKVQVQALLGKARF
jgi:hypothetical protein